MRVERPTGPAWLSGNVAVLTGAGASVPLGLFTTRRFLDDFFENDVALMTATDADLWAYVEALRNIASQAEWDVEHLLDFLSADEAGANRFMTHPLFLMRVLGGNALALSPFIAHTTRILEALRTKVVDHYGSVDSADAAR